MGPSSCVHMRDDQSRDIDQLLADASVPPEIDFMSIDIDGNDYWVWTLCQSHLRKL